MTAQPEQADLKAAEQLQATYRRMTEQLGRVIFGQNEVLKHVYYRLKY